MASRRFWTAWIVVLVCAAIVGIGIGLNIVGIEDWEGLWKRKRGFVESAHPESKPLLDEAEQRAKGARLVP